MNALDDRLTLADASELVGLTPRALARRIERGTLAAEKDARGRRTVSRRDLAAAGLLDLATGKPPTWTRTPEGETLARALLTELTQRGVRIAELEAGHHSQAEQIEELRRQLRQAARERAELRRRLDKLQPPS